MTEDIIATPPNPLDRFMHNGIAYAWIEVPIEMLLLIVPENTGIREAESWGKVLIGEEEDGTPIYRQKTMEEFLLTCHKSLDGKFAIAPLAPMESPTLRTKRVTKADIEAWIPMLANYGIAVEQWLDITQYKQLISSDRYTKEI
jgi:hypothetical protein